MNQAIYLDYNATAPTLPAVIESVGRALALTGNPSSVHTAGRAARYALDDARARVAHLVGATPDRVLFTSGGTEANHLALRGSGRERCLTSSIEHPSVLAAAPAIRAPVNGDGCVDLDFVETWLASDPSPALLSIMLANNETGVLQPIDEIAALARRFGALLHCDAVQAAGRVPIPMQSIDFLTLSAHKIGAPKGVGALVLGEHVEITPQLCGGGQELGRRAGTENVAGIVGFGVAADLAQADLGAQKDLAILRDLLEHRARAAVPGLIVYGDKAPRLANTSCLGVPGLSGETQVMALDLAGIAVSSGAACSSGKVGPSHVLCAMGADEEGARSAIRISLGAASRPADIDRFLEAWLTLMERTASQPGRAIA